MIYYRYEIDLKTGGVTESELEHKGVDFRRTYWYSDIEERVIADALSREACIGMIRARMKNMLKHALTALESIDGFEDGEEF